MSCIYSVTCQVCGEKLEASVRMDADEDLLVEVEPCSSCLATAKDEGRKAAEESESS